MESTETTETRQPAAPDAAGVPPAANPNGTTSPAEVMRAARAAPGRAAPSEEPLFAPIAGDLVAVDELIRATAEVDNVLLRQTLRLTLSASGKRLRPALTLLAARLHENAIHRRVELAVAAELLHTATLVHDDVIDVSTARRGHQTVNAALGNTVAVLTGDYLFGRSGELVAGLGSPAIMGVFSWAVMELVKGEMLRPTLDGDLAETERAYLAKIEGKTASLFAMCSQTGAMLDADDPALVARLRAYGLNLGMAFQIVDDVLDYTATEEALGKPVGSDLRQGTITLPAIYFLQERAGDEVVHGLLSHDESYFDRAGDAVDAIRGSGAIDRALEAARRYATAAAAQLDGVPASPYAGALRRLAHYVVDRNE
ncbi:MAG: polyprenyl synthetase family protein [Chloroflexi bacterium]|nr:polyprenyl synthetase family protein [Chloroflexota bacterium]